MENDPNVTILHGVGIQLTEYSNKLILTRSKAGKRIDTIGLVLGSFSFLILAYSIGLLIYEIKNNNLHIATAFPIILLFILGGYLFSLFMQGMGRKLMFGKFSLEKNLSEFILTQKVNFKLQQHTFDRNSQLTITKNNKDISLNLIDNNSENKLFELKDLNDEQLERVENIVAKMNS